MRSRSFCPPQVNIDDKQIVEERCLDREKTNVVLSLSVFYFTSWIDWTVPRRVFVELNSYWLMGFIIPWHIHTTLIGNSSINRASLWINKILWKIAMKGLYWMVWQNQLSMPFNPLNSSFDYPNVILLRSTISMEIFLSLDSFHVRLNRQTLNRKHQNPRRVPIPPIEARKVEG